MGALGLGRIETGQAQEYPYRGRLIAWLVFDFALTFLNWASRLSSGTPKQNIAYDWSTAIGSVIQFAFLLFILGLIARGRWELLLEGDRANLPRILARVPRIAFG